MMALRSRLAFLGEPSRRVVVSSDGEDCTLDGVRVLERMNSLIVMPANVARVLICRCCSGSISMVSLFISQKLPRSPTLSTYNFPPAGNGLVAGHSTPPSTQDAPRCHTIKLSHARLGKLRIMKRGRLHYSSAIHSSSPAILSFCSTNDASGFW